MIRHLIGVLLWNAFDCNPFSLGISFSCATLWRLQVNITVNITGMNCQQYRRLIGLFGIISLFGSSKVNAMMPALAIAT